ncbi:MAG: CDP-alcohol phosphatidyltransferase family protein [Gammaproteobacteria bacterium]|nr:CDP-alcohol phosphatidyltransferase family protein [Gammaproteobacteria bacterium]MCW8988751.1 CDP-alcohol phosphatidyltransferase family protein [Gammaproteobacteria bacterium]MCW9030639.1 CDP-alcohol phosphatidyltransferase family protein [Gammaproteobacteria bacterium]
MKKSDIPNVISIIRIVMVIPIAFCLWNQNFLTALLLFLVGGLSDGLDGFLARRYHWQTALGVILDPMGDKLMMLAAYLLLGWHNLLPWWLVVLVISRDLIIVLGSLLYRKFVGEAKLKPLFISKLNTTVQIILVLLVMLSQVIEIHLLIIDGFIWLVAVTTLLSGYAYINEWGRRAWRILKEKKVY